MNTARFSTFLKYKARYIAAVRSWLKPRARSDSLGASIVELALTFPVALTIVLGSVHLGAILREANIIVEAASHGARSVTAASGEDPVTLPSFHGPITKHCNFTKLVAPNSKDWHEIALVAACSYLEASKLIGPEVASPVPPRDEWNVTTRIYNLVENGTTVSVISVTLFPKDARGPVEKLKLSFNVRPSSTSIYPLFVLIP